MSLRRAIRASRSLLGTSGTQGDVASAPTASRGRPGSGFITCPTQTVRMPRWRLSPRWCRCCARRSPRTRIRRAAIVPSTSSAGLAVSTPSTSRRAARPKSGEKDSARRAAAPGKPSIASADGSSRSPGRARACASRARRSSRHSTAKQCGVMPKLRSRTRSGRHARLSKSRRARGSARRSGSSPSSRSISSVQVWPRREVESGRAAEHGDDGLSFSDAALRCCRVAARC